MRFNKCIKPIEMSTFPSFLAIVFAGCEFPLITSLFPFRQDLKAVLSPLHLRPAESLGCSPAPSPSVHPQFSVHRTQWLLSKFPPLQ